ncbi:MAG: c-type cytochrome [Janthinobacterium lividum]
MRNQTNRALHSPTSGRASGPVLRGFFTGILALGLTAAAGVHAADAPTTPTAPTAPSPSRATPASNADAALVARGAYLATAGDCIACHTAAHGKPYAGGLPMKVPMLGTIHASNITPDPTTGIGNWTFADFDRALRRGVSRDGHNLYPAMPYVSYAKLSDDDVKALHAFFRNGVAPVRHTPPASDIPWPLNMRWPLKFWNLAFLKPGSYEMKTGRSAEWNRGAYLVQGLAHCGTCHTARRVTLQEKALDESGAGYLGGAALAGWDAYNITSSKRAGIGNWTHAQLAQYLRTGNVPGVAQAAGPMGEAVEHSFSHLSSADIDAIATYIRTVPAVEDGSARARQDWGSEARDVATLRGRPLETALDPARLYLGNCASCHQANGKGTPDAYYPSLLRNSTVGATHADNLIQVILHGVHRQTPGDDVGMPGFGQQLSDAQIAALASYVTQRFGNPAVKVSDKDVARLR